MNILEHRIYKEIYDLCQEIEKLPASPQSTKVVVLASDLEKSARKLIEALRRIREYPVHSEPVGGAMEMKDIAHEALC